MAKLHERSSSTQDEDEPEMEDSLAQASDDLEVKRCSTSEMKYEQVSN